MLLEYIFISVYPFSTTAASSCWSFSLAYHVVSSIHHLISGSVWWFSRYWPLASLQPNGVHPADGIIRNDSQPAKVQVPGTGIPTSLPNCNAWIGESITMSVAIVGLTLMKQRVCPAEIRSVNPCRVYQLYSPWTFYHSGTLPDRPPGRQFSIKTCVDHNTFTIGNSTPPLRK